jgi:hypothetical protein
MHHTARAGKVEPGGGARCRNGISESKAPDEPAVVRTLHNRAFNTIDTTNPDAQSDDRATLIRKGVPQRLVDRLFADRQAFLQVTDGQLLAQFEPKVPHDLEVIRADGIRTGVIQPGDTIDNELNGYIAQAQAEMINYTVSYHVH